MGGLVPGSFFANNVHVLLVDLWIKFVNSVEIDDNDVDEIKLSFIIDLVHDWIMSIEHRHHHHDDVGLKEKRTFIEKGLW